MMARGKLVDDELTGSVIGAFYEVYHELGFGFLEHVYVAALERELAGRGHSVGREVGVSVLYKGQELAFHRVDMLVDGRLVVEVKSSPQLPKTALRQLHNYLSGTKLELGLLLHFGEEPRFYRKILTNDFKRRSGQ